MANTENMTKNDLDHHSDQLNKNEGTPGINDPYKAVEANRHKQKAENNKKDS